MTLEPLIVSVWVDGVCPAMDGDLSRVYSRLSPADPCQKDTENILWITQWLYKLRTNLLSWHWHLTVLNVWSYRVSWSHPIVVSD